VEPVGKLKKMFSTKKGLVVVGLGFLSVKKCSSSVTVTYKLTIFGADISYAQARWKTGIGI